ncbi:hypothetical protein ACFW1A_00470 [Kitasatospora sp. NPDC058965]|uniref:hypothetical protein n=1 Tax=Kitasatospora sp. NPDC058965 TaxID=3346682 RepID=UPI0036BF4B53
MTDDALVRAWKNPAARKAVSFHPAGEIQLGQSGGPGRRAGLLAGMIGPITYDGASEMSVSAMTVTSVTIV